jgi:hypothetical protein
MISANSLASVLIHLQKGRCIAQVNLTTRNTKMKTTIKILVIAFIISLGHMNAQDVTTVTAANSDISQNLDLEAVASIFGESENLEDFEKRLNDPDTRISNLDLNGDGEVDYLRVIENTKNETHLITIQAVLGNDLFQDVATIDVEKDSQGVTQVQVVGDVYMYGPDYIITPVYVHRPVIFVWFWGPYYRPWYSPYYWDYYPPYYRPWRPYPTPRYRTNVHVHVNVNNSYRYSSVRRSNTAIELQKQARRNDYGSKHPDRSFKNRTGNQVSGRNNAGVYETKTRPVNTNRSTGKPVQKDWKPQSERKGSESNVRDNKVSTPTTKPGSSQTTKPTTTTIHSKTAKPVNRKTPNPSGKPNSTQKVKTASSKASKSPSKTISSKAGNQSNRKSSSSPNRQRSKSNGKQKRK